MKGPKHWHDGLADCECDRIDWNKIDEGDYKHDEYLSEVAKLNEEADCNEIY